LLKGEEKNVGVESELEASGDNDIAVVTSDTFGFKFGELYSD